MKSISLASDILIYFNHVLQLPLNSLASKALLGDPKQLLLSRDTAPKRMKITCRAGTILVHDVASLWMYFVMSCDILRQSMQSSLYRSWMFNGYWRFINDFRMLFKCLTSLQFCQVQWVSCNFLWNQPWMYFPSPIKKRKHNVTHEDLFLGDGRMSDMERGVLKQFYKSIELQGTWLSCLIQSLGRKVMTLGDSSPFPCSQKDQKKHQIL